MSKIMMSVITLLLVGMLFSACQLTPERTIVEEPVPVAQQSKVDESASILNVEAYIPVVSMGFQHQYWQAVRQGAEQAAEKYNVTITFEGPESETMVDKQIEMAQAALAKNPQAICLAPIDAKAIIPFLEETKAKGIPVITFDATADSDIPVAHVATNNILAGAAAADKIAELINGAGEVAVISHSQTDHSAVERVKGFTEQINEKYPNIKIVDIQFGDGDHLKSTELAKAIIQAYPELKGMFGSNEGSAIGIVMAVKELKKEGVTIIGFDSAQQQIEAIRTGLQAGAITQNPIGMGYKCIETAVKIIRGEHVDKVIDTGFFYYDKTNIDDPKIKALLYD